MDLVEREFLRRERLEELEDLLEAQAAQLRDAREALEKMKRSRDRYREEWERARGREEAAANAFLAKS
jgi:uncharacterized membrane protein YccC